MVILVIIYRFVNQRLAKRCVKDKDFNSQQVEEIAVLGNPHMRGCGKAIKAAPGLRIYFSCQHPQEFMIAAAQTIL